MPERERPRERIPGLDALRGLAAVAVLAFHYTTRFGIVFGHPTRPWFVVPWGLHGVEVFFVISGFAIELSLESMKTARDFLVSRALRLYPTFWAAVAVTFTVVGVFGLPERVASPRDALLNLSMVPASLGAQAVDAVYWTLERELRFYGLVLLLLVLGLRRYTVHALLIAVAVQTVDAASHVVPHWISDLLNAHWAHLFACGALLARSRHAPSWKTLGFLGLCLASSRLVGAVPFTYGAGAVGLVWIATHPFVGARLRPLVFLGKISYPLYLAHQYIGYVVMRALYARGAPPSVAIALACAVAFAIAIALHFLVEEPCLQLQRRAFGYRDWQSRGRNQSKAAVGVAALLLTIGACDGGSDAGSGSPTGTGGACQDYVTPDGFTCCCKKAFCSRDPSACSDYETTTAVPSSRGTGGGSGGANHSSGGANHSSGGADRSSGGASAIGPSDAGSSGGTGGANRPTGAGCVTTLPGPANAGFQALNTQALPLADGGVLALGQSCPEVPYKAYASGILTPFSLAFPGCCMPSGQCGGSTVAFQQIVEGQVEEIYLPGPACACVGYADLKAMSGIDPVRLGGIVVTVPNAKTCTYPKPRDAGMRDGERD